MEAARAHHLGTTAPGGSVPPPSVQDVNFARFVECGPFLAVPLHAKERSCGVVETLRFGSPRKGRVWHNFCGRAFSCCTMVLCYRKAIWVGSWIIAFRILCRSTQTAQRPVVLIFSSVRLKGKSLLLTRVILRFDVARISTLREDKAFDKGLLEVTSV